MSAASALILVSGGSYAQRETAIAAALRDVPPGQKIAVILEGLPDGSTPLQNESLLQLQRIAPGCFCCIGNLALRVTLNRLLRQHPARLYLSVASDAHLPQLEQLLQQAPYAQLLLAEAPICL